MIRQEKRRFSPKVKRLLFFGGLLFCILLLWIVFAPNSGLLSYWEQKSRLEQLAGENSRLVVENVELVEEIHRLRMDEAHLEWVAREKHGLLKKNESVYEFKKRNEKKKE